MTADLTPARCGSTAVHPPHPIDGAAPGVADCDGLKRRATDTEIAQARAWVEHAHADTGHSPELDAERQDEFAHALEILVHANGGRYTEPAPAVGRCGERAPQLFPTVPAVHCALLADHTGWHRGDDGSEWTEGDAMRPATPDRLVTAVLDAAITWRRDGFGPAEFIAGQADDFTDQELALITAVDAMLAARSSDETGLLNRSESPLPAERGADGAVDTLDGPGGAEGPAATDLGTLLERGESVCSDHHAVWPDCAAQHEPVTPAADLADEAAHERVARAIHRFGYSSDATAERAWNEIHSIREVAYNLAKVAIDAYHAGPTPDPHAGDWQTLVHGLYRHGIHTGSLEGDTPTDVVRATLAHIDRLTTALDEAARDQLDDLEPDGGYTAAQEARADAVKAAARLGIKPEGTEAAAEAAAARAVLAVAQIYEAFIRDGDVPDDGPIEDPWAAAAPTSLEAAAEEHAHEQIAAGSFCPVCGWSPPDAPTTRPVLDGDGALNTTTETAPR